MALVEMMIAQSPMATYAKDRSLDPLRTIEPTATYAMPDRRTTYFESAPDAAVVATESIPV